VNPFLFRCWALPRLKMVGKILASLSPFKRLRAGNVIVRQCKHCHVRFEDMPFGKPGGSKSVWSFTGDVLSQASCMKGDQCHVFATSRTKAGTVKGKMTLSFWKELNLDDCGSRD